MRVSVWLIFLVKFLHLETSEWSTAETQGDGVNIIAFHCHHFTWPSNSKLGVCRMNYWLQEMTNITSLSTQSEEGEEAPQASPCQLLLLFSDILYKTTLYIIINSSPSPSPSRGEDGGEVEENKTKRHHDDNNNFCRVIFCFFLNSTSSLFCASLSLWVFSLSLWMIIQLFCLLRPNPPL